MYYAIKTLEKRLLELKEEEKRLLGVLDEPELIIDIIWSRNDLLNLANQVNDITKAILILHRLGQVAQSMREGVKEIENAKANNQQPTTNNPNPSIN